MQLVHIRDLSPLLPAHGRLLALDVGDKVIGLALSDLSRMIASPLGELRRKKWTQDKETLRAILAEHAIHGIIIGLPVNMDGTEGPRAQSVRSLARNLEAVTDIPIAFWDERLSTNAANRVMLEADLSRQKRREHKDKLAATLILQGALDFLENQDR